MHFFPELKGLSHSDQLAWFMVCDGMVVTRAGVLWVTAGITGVGEGQFALVVAYSSSGRK